MSTITDNHRRIVTEAYIPPWHPAGGSADAADVSFLDLSQKG